MTMNSFRYQTNSRISLLNVHLMTLPLSVKVRLKSMVTSISYLSIALWPMATSSSAKPPGQPRRRSSTARKRDLNSTRKLKRWRKPKCAEISPCISSANMVIRAPTPTRRTSWCPSLIFHPITRLSYALNTKNRATACTAKGANSCTAFTICPKKTRSATAEDWLKRLASHGRELCKAQTVCSLTLSMATDAQHRRKGLNALNRSTIRKTIKLTFRKRSRILGQEIIRLLNQKPSKMSSQCQNHTPVLSKIHIMLNHLSQPTKGREPIRKGVESELFEATLCNNTIKQTKMNEYIARKSKKYLILYDLYWILN